MGDRKLIGQKGEDIAAGYLEQQGCTILERNVRTAYGEIDLIVQRVDVTVFVEVKTRTSRAFGFPETGITEQKMMHMVQCAEDYLQLHPEICGPWQLDVVSVELNTDGKYDVEWFENAI
jgi:putative endonuclease